MMAEQDPAGAVSRREVKWQAIDWQAAHQNVRRLQARIVKATQEGRWGKVKALQRLLTHSFSGKVLAVRRVTENDGRKTPGVDGEIWNTSEKKAQAVETLRQHGYHPKPLRRLYIPKSNGKKRPLGIPTMRDRAMQALYLLALDPVAETTADPNSYGFRKERSCADAIEQCYKALVRRDCAQWILEADITACFDRISHEWLLAHVPMDKTILRKWLQAGYIDKCALYATQEGTPQGGIISPVLANLALDGLEKRLRERFSVNTRPGYKVNFIRYADDFVVTGISRELLENEVKPLIEEFLRERGLALSPEKTRITHIEDGFDFLGQNVRKYHGKLLIQPSKKNVRTFLTALRRFVKANWSTSAGNLIGQLNPKIRGWANYHRHVVSSRTFGYVDNALYHYLWRWAKRRHNNKGHRWIWKTYFRRVGLGGWTFCGEKTTSEGETQTLYLYKASKTSIKRHTKIQNTANPYDPNWEVYLETRLGVKMAANLRGRRRLSYLWKEQNGLCPVCHEKITKLTGWHNHHIVWRSLGGSDGVENRVLLHPTCHRQVHSLKLSISKPRLATGV
ncbi:MAG: RNA-directed polymerase [Chthonomonadales bacterium]|nr:RNA-directed polymerase [Chthonomonadales bacterium]